MKLGMPYYELEDAVVGGAKRNLHGLLIGRKHYFHNTNPWGANIESAVGEDAVSLWRGRHWQPLHADPRGVADVGSMGEVRHTKVRGEPVLRVYPWDRDDRAFMLVNVVIAKHDGKAHFTEALHPCVEVLGWIMGGDAKRDKFRRQYGDDVCWELRPEYLIQVAA